MAVNSLLYLCQKAKENGQKFSFMQIAKLLFYADKLHLKRYGRPITGDTYIKMDHGPNPSAVYDYLKDVRTRLDLRDEFIKVELEPNPPHAPKPFIIPLREADLGVFSDSDREVLEEVFSQYGAKTAKQLRDLSHHEKAWQEAELEMAYEDFLDPEDEAMANYIQETQDAWAGLESLQKPR
ncbi:MAG: Panacea domain-containing protein [Nitrospinaceae bacterium]